jgi:hypothetical protein
LTPLTDIPTNCKVIRLHEYYTGFPQQTLGVIKVTVIELVIDKTYVRAAVGKYSSNVGLSKYFQSLGLFLNLSQNNKGTPVR